MYETQVETFLATVASGICCIELMRNSENPTSTKVLIVAFIFLFAGKYNQEFCFEKCINILRNVCQYSTLQIFINSKSFVFFFCLPEIMECIAAIKLIAPSIVFAGLSSMSFKTPYSAILAAVGILTGVSGWVMNFVQYNRMRNRVTQSPTSDQPISLNNEPTRGNDVISANGSKSDQV